MAFPEDIAAHAERIRDRLPHVRGEESTKQALVIPLLSLLGYDVYDPREIRTRSVRRVSDGIALAM